MKVRTGRIRSDFTTIGTILGFTLGIMALFIAPYAISSATDGDDTCSYQIDSSRWNRTAEFHEYPEKHHKCLVYGTAEGGLLIGGSIIALAVLYLIYTLLLLRYTDRGENR